MDFPISIALPFLFALAGHITTEDPNRQVCYVSAQIVSALKDQSGMYAVGVTQCVQRGQLVFHKPVALVVALNGANEPRMGSQISYQVSAESAPYPAAAISNFEGAQVTWAQYGTRRDGAAYRGGKGKVAPQEVRR